MEDIVGDYTDKTVTLEDFPHFASSVKMASIHPCKHAHVMKILLDRADAALRRRKQKASGPEGLTAGVEKMQISQSAEEGGEGWEVLDSEDPSGGVGKDEGDAFYDPDSAIQVHQYLVVFLKFAAGMVPTIEYDQTMAVG